MELEQEVVMSEQCRGILAYLDKWAIDRKKELFDNLCATTDTNEMIAIRGEMLGIINLQQSLVSKIENGKVAKMMLKELR